MNQVIIQKFGGTSVQDAAAMRRVMEIVVKHGVKRNLRPLVVLSACAGVTNLLVRIGELALLKHFEEAHTIITELDERHFTILHELRLPLRDEQEAALELRYIWRELRTMVRGIELLGELTEKMKDKLVSAGERASTTIFAHACGRELSSRKIPVLFCDAREFFLTDSAFTAARPITSEICKRMKPIAKRLNSGAVCITQGFIGANKRGETTTIGRGGSDFSASIMGVALSAKEIQIWTDVAGIYTCDPRIVAEAYAQRIINFADASTMAFYGAKVLHPETIGPAVEAGIPVRVLSSKEPQKEGTTIVLSTDTAEAITGIALKRNVVLVQIRSGELLPTSATLPPIFDALNDRKIVPLASSISFDNTMLVLDSLDDAHSISAALAQQTTVEIDQHRALLTLVGHGLEHSAGIAARLFKAIKGCNCEMISYGGASNALSVVVAEAALEGIVRRVHKEFFRV